MSGKHRKELFGGELDTTNNRMEMTAVIRGAEAINNGSVIDIYTDSKYVMKGMMEWVEGWKKRGWKTASKQPVKNVDLWQQLEQALERHEVNWHWVKGHSGVAENDRADELARQGIP